MVIKEFVEKVIMKNDFLKKAIKFIYLVLPIHLNILLQCI